MQSHSLSEYPNAFNWNSSIGEEQKEWLKERLYDAKKKKQKVIVFNHYPVLSESAEGSHTLWNGSEIVDILESKEFEGVVVAHLNGHYHQGGFVTHNKIHYWTVHGILEAPPGILSVSMNCLFIHS